jgi:hypothetical protein
MHGIDPETAISALRLWIAAGSAAILVFLCVLAYTRPSPATTISALRAGAIVLGAILGASMASALVERPAVRHQGGERRAFELRAQELTMRAMAPGSALACLDALAGESVQAACESEIFATPASTATATSYVAARFALLADMVAYARRGGSDIDGLLLPLRRSLEADRFGFLAHVLAVRDGCASGNCKALALLHDASHVRANLSARTFDGYVQHHLAAWDRPHDEPVAANAEGEPNAAAALNAQGRGKVIVDADFPTAASIPPISIMNPEPKGPVPSAAAGNPNAAASAASAATATAAAPRRRTRRRAGKSPQQAAMSQTDPVWTPSPSRAAAAAAAPVRAGPVQLNSFSAPPAASAGVTMRTQ